MTIEIIMKLLQDWKQTHDNKFPETLYLQLDGGAENANKYVLAHLEMLVAKRIVTRIIFSRLPVGHTHEDIDSCFAVIWNWFKRQTIKTPQEFKDFLEEASRNGKRPMEVVDILCVSNWKDFLRRHIDPELKYLHKLGDAMLQWSFEAVDCDNNFPFGVKTMYRAYASDEVVKIVKVSRFHAVTQDAALTGNDNGTDHDDDVDDIFNNQN